MKVVKKMKQNRTIPKMFFNEHEHEGGEKDETKQVNFENVFKSNEIFCLC